MDKNIPLTEAAFYILVTVRRPNHGYGIIQEVSDMTGSRVVLGPGTLYGAINSLLAKNWISLYSEEKDSRKKKEYIITPKGVQIMKEEIQRLNELIDNSQCMGDLLK